MTIHTTGTRSEWLTARLELLEAEKDLTRRSDELARRRQELPWVRIDEEYTFETDDGTASLTDLFRGRSQLLVYHFMFGPDYAAGCPSCSSIADGFEGIAVQRRLQRLVHRGATAAWNGRLQLPARGSVAAARRRWPGRRARGHDRHRRGHVHARAAWRERLRARRWCRLSHLLRLCARTGRPLGRVPVARSRAQGPQRIGHLVAPPR
jgi:hypothetical protein